MWLQRLHCDIPSGGRQTSCHLALIRLRRPLNGGLQRDCNCQQRADLDEADDFAQLNLIFVPNLANPFYKQAFMLACLPSFVCGLGSDLSAAFRGHILGALLPSLRARRFGRWVFAIINDVVVFIASGDTHCLSRRRGAFDPWGLRALLIHSCLALSV